MFLVLRLTELHQDTRHVSKLESEKVQRTRAHDILRHFRILFGTVCQKLRRMKTIFETAWMSSGLQKCAKSVPRKKSQTEKLNSFI